MSAILKSCDVPRQRSCMSTFHMRDLLKEARAVVDSAREHAEHVLAQAKAHAAELKEQARQEGFKKGFQQGHEQGRTAGRQSAFDEAQARFDGELKSVHRTLLSATAQLNGQRQQRLDAAERDLLEFALQLAGRMAKRIGRLDRQAVRENLKAALTLVVNKTDVRVAVHPQDLDCLEAFAADDLQQLGSHEHICFVKDDTVSPGGVMVYSPEGEVDATLDAQLEQIAGALTVPEAE